MKLLNVAGNKYGKLTAIKFINRENNQTFWEFKCDCGKITIKRLNRVISGDTRSCGCNYNNSKKRALINKRALNKQYNSYKRSANKRNYTFNLDRDQFIEIVSKNCHYCGSEPNRIPIKYKDDISYSDIKCNGIDRKDNNIGYVYDNCLPCCTICNFAKGKMDYSKFILWIEKIKLHNN